MNLQYVHSKLTHGPEICQISLKSPKFFSNFLRLGQSDHLIIQLANLTKPQTNLVKIVDFLIIAYFWAMCQFRVDIMQFRNLAFVYILSFIYQVRRANSERERLTRLQKKEISLAKMLIVVVVVFFVCNVVSKTYLGPKVTA